MKLAIVLAVLAIPASAAINRLSRLGPSLAALTQTNNTADEAGQGISITAGAAGVRNCLSRIAFVANSTSTLRVLNGATTVYALDVAANAPLTETFSDDDMCGSSATALVVKVSTAVKAATLGTQQLSYTGFTY